ncbi:hypothetical protein BaRGS_00033091 [Batillaria attramentaria]|uniref:RRM domain-containing protein n=1 Tax=Batillaria attramentaria TaxID=370345 RepID=A0ABD0JLQ8_9CAEN
MSRLIVKNLPKETKEETLRKLFSEKGTVTDCSLKFTKTGVFRRFGFVGFSNEDEAKEAQRYFDKTFVNTSRIQVEFAKDFGDVKPRAWSKYSRETKEKPADASKEKQGTAKVKKKGKKKEDRVESLLGDLKDDPEFQEFLEVHRKDEGGNSSDDTDEEEDTEEKTVPDKKPEKPMSDLEYLKSKMKADASDDDRDDNDSQEKKSPKKQKQHKTSPVKQSPDTASATGTEKTKKFVVKMKGLVANVREKAVREFFKPLSGLKIRIPTNANKQSIGIAFVEFRSEKDLEAAMGRNKNFIGGKKIFLKKVTEEIAEAPKEEKPRPWELKKAQEEDGESIAESGKLFVRNLAYVCTEEALEAMFSKFGPVAEFDLPVDPWTKKIKGFAHVTYMIPEHAVKAYTELDGKAFMGRMMHILPGKSNDEKYESSERSSFKKKKDEQQKALAKSSHNWNALFLGADAVASAMAEKYGTEKSHILDDSNKGSLGVRMALGETQLVQETRDFLIENGVALDSFSQASGERSKSAILAKNLPSGTKQEELQEIFSKYGSITRVLLPPSGITAIIEFQEPSEAKRAFTKLAYTKFHYLPLYLEWAPMNVFVKDAQPASQKSSEGMELEEGQDTAGAETSQEKKDSGVESESEEEAEPGATLFVKNLNFTTDESALKTLFSKCGEVLRATVSKKKDMKNPGKFLSMGYGFVEYKTAAAAQEAMKTLQSAELDGHTLVLKLSNREALKPKVSGRKKAVETKQKSTKILVRNIPFEAKRREVEELFKVFGELKYVRLPKKLSGTGTHRGFAFVDFLTKQDAKRAFDALCHSTHLYGRRLVLEWAETAETIDDLRRKTSKHFHEGGPSKKLKRSALMESLA